MRKILSLVLALAMVLSLGSVAFAAETSFTDVEEGKWYSEAVAWAVEKGVTNGYGSETTFAPDVTCDRGQIVTMLYRYAGEPEVEPTTQFTDLESDWYKAPVAWAVEQGITKGKGEADTFKPADACSRAEVVTFLYRYAGEPEVEATEQFTDLTADWYADAVAWAVEMEITKGYGSDTTFCPDQACSRAEIATFLSRYDAAAEEPVVEPEEVITEAGQLAYVDVPANESVVYNIHGRLSGNFLNIVAAEGVTVEVNGVEIKAENGMFSAELTGAPMNKVVVTNTTDKAVSLVADIVAPEGTEGNPVVIDEASELTSVEVAANGTTVYAVNAQLNGNTLVIVAAEGVTVEVNGKAIEAVNGLYSVELTGAPVNKVVVTNTTDKDVELVAAIEAPLGSEGNPIAVNEASDLTSVEVAAKGATVYAVNAQLNGNTLVIVAAEGVTVEVNGKAIEAVDGLYSAELTGAPVNKVIVTNTTDKAATLVAEIAAPEGTEGNPIVIDEAIELTSVEVAANGTTVYAVNAQLNGNILNIVAAEGVTVTVNGTAVEAVNGIHSVELTGAPVNKVVVANANDEAVELVAAIEAPLGSENNPIIITEAGDFGIDVPAAGEVYYAIPAQMNGMILTVIGNENITVTVNDEAVEADWEYISTATLAGAPMNMVVIENAAETAAELSANLNWPLGSESNPEVVDPLNFAFVYGNPGTTYWNIPSTQNGNYLNLAAMEGLSYQVNGVDLTDANFGWYSVELTGVPANRLVITNTLEYTEYAEASIGTKKGSAADNAYTYNDPYTPATFALATGETIYASPNAGDMIATVKNAEGLSIEVNGTVYEPVEGVIEFVVPARASFFEPPTVLAITSANGGSYTMSFAFPEGHMENPEVVTDLANLNTVLPEGTGDYNYIWTATAYGELKIDVSDITVAEGAVFGVEVYNLSSYAMSNYDEAVDGIITVAVNPDDQVRITVNAAIYGTNWWEPATYPGGTFNLKGEFVKLTGAELVEKAYALGAGEVLAGGNYTLTAKVTEIVSAYSGQYKNITVNVAVEGLEDKPVQCFRLTGTDIDLIAVGDTITVTGTLKNYNGTIEFDKPVLDKYEPVEAFVKPATAPEIVDAAYALEGGASLRGAYTLTGVITSVDAAYSENYGNVTVTIAVDGCDPTKTIQCFRLKGDDAANLAVGDTITVHGILKNYVNKSGDSTIEFDAGCWIEAYTAATPEEPAPEEPGDASSVKYTFSDYVVDGELGGGEFTRELDENVTFTISSGWFTSQARIYKNANGVIASKKAISSVVLNAGNKNSTFDVYTSEDGVTWTMYQEDVAYTSAYADVTIDFETPVKYIKIDAPNAQIRMMYMTITFAE